MGKYVAENVVKKLIAADIPVKNARVAILGFTFKENCPDTRNTAEHELQDLAKGKAGTDIFFVRGAKYFDRPTAIMVFEQPSLIKHIPENEAVDVIPVNRDPMLLEFPGGPAAGERHPYRQRHLRQ